MLNKEGLKNNVKQLLQDMMQREQASFDEFADRLANAVDAYVKTGTVTVAAGIPVQVAVPAGTGATTGTGTGTIS